MGYPPSALSGTATFWKEGVISLPALIELASSFDL